ncbi:MAG: N-acetyltransferase [Bacteroidota bacterium]
MTIRTATPEDLPTVWQLFQEIIDQKVYYPYDEYVTLAQIEAWVNTRNLIGVVELDGQIAGAYIVRPNQPGYGAHVANAAYMVSEKFRNRGLGRALGQHSLAAAKSAGYRAMQYNFVVSTNTSAVHLWQELGFDIIGTIPGGFRHHELGYVDAYIMFQPLLDKTS